MAFGKCNYLSGENHFSVWPSLELKGCFPTFRWNILCFILCPLALILSPGINGKSLAHFLQHFFRDSYRRDPPEPVLLWEEVSALSAFPHMLLVLNHCHGPMLDSLEYVNVLFWVPGTGPGAAGVTSPVLRQEKDHLPQPVGSTFNPAS